MSACVDCGSPTGGLRCKKCHGRSQADQALADTAASDRELLAMVDAGVKGTRIAVMTGVSKTAAYRRIKDARQRTARRAEKGW